jgi:hypothetical protein
MVKRFRVQTAMDAPVEYADVVLASDYDALAAELASEREAGLRCFEDKVKLETALRDLIHSYVCLLESGRDRIKMLGGDCDDVPTMERNDPALIRARAVLTPAQRDSKHE